MKIEGPNRTQGSSETKRKNRTSKSGSSFEDFISKESTASAETGASKQIAGVDALLSVQAAEDPTERAARRRMHERSEKILDELETIKIAMLTGSLTVGHMIDIADVVASHREKIQDPEMAELMDEIDLRAQVELAKMRISMDRTEEG